MAHAWDTSLILVVALGLTTPGCGGKASSPSGEGEGGLEETGGTRVTGGQSQSSGGSETGGAETNDSGGSAGGGADSGGSPSGGSGQGGSPTGGRGQGGTSTGGLGRADSGGTGQSGSSSGGAVSGGASTGGATTGGAIQGGMGPGGDGHGGIVSGGEGGVSEGGQTATGGSTSTCKENTDCDPEEVCGADGLCWPAGSQCTIVSTGDGFVTCEEGYVYREEALACTISVPRADYECGNGSCTTDSDCAHLNYGHCSPNPLSMGVCTCFEGCQTDADCDANMLCQCLPSLGVGRCMAAQCSGPADCDPGRRCASYTGFACGVIAGFACQTDEDECTSDRDCGSGACQLGPEGHRICDSCAIS